MADIPAIAAFEPGERRVLAGMLARGVNAPLTSSAGRLFDAVAAILGLQQKAGFEGEAAMAVEFAADRATNTSPLASLTLSKGPGKLVIDWRPLLATLVDAVRIGVAREELAAAFHDALAEVIVSVARCIGIKRVLLTGGCFQNARLVELTVIRLRKDGFDPYWHHRIPPNDGGLAAGQIVFAARPLIEEHD
jgi:hydrogenase maturation protein HypF